MAKEPVTPRMQCMEVWGGNTLVMRSLQLTGANLWVYSRPQGGAPAGGDIHYVSACVSGRVTRILVADVSGHGEQVAEVAGVLRGLIRRYVNYIDQSSLVQRVNARFCDYFQDGLFATALVATYYAPTKHFALSNAGHPPPLLYRAKERRWAFLETEPLIKDLSARDMPLGVASDIPYTSRSTYLEPGDLVLCYTDFLLEMRSGAEGCVGTEGLLALVQGVSTEAPSSFIPSLLETAEKQYHVALGDEDDATIVLMQCTGSAKRAPYLAELKALGKLIRAIVLPRAETGPIPWPEISIVNLLGFVVPLFNRFWKPKPD